jgi:hypothetical protein
MNASSKKWYESNKDTHAELTALWRMNNESKMREYRVKRKLTHAERDREVIKAWKTINREKVASYTAKRREMEKKATPEWANLEDMAMWQDVANVLSRSGVPFEVDHIVPIVSDKVCGLHWEGNMQVLPRYINIAKQNRYWPDMP